MLIRILGGLDLRSAAGAALRLPTRRAALVLAALVLAAKGLRREALCDAFWPDRGEQQARSSLRQALTAIRAVFPDAGPGPRLDSEQETLRLLAEPEAVDLWRFDALAAGATPDRLAAAAELYQGDVLAGIALPESLEAWLAPHRQAARRKALALVERLSQLAPGDACRTLAERLLATDPAAEEAHRALIRQSLAEGRRNAALRQFELCREALRRELDAEPEPETAALLRDAPPAPAAPPPAIIPSPPRDRDQPGVIVMPFDNLSGEGDGYFADGVVEEITGALSRVKEFFVIARQSAFTYKGRFVDVREVGRELGVGYVVEGTVRRGGDRLRISVQLVDATTRGQLWSDRFEGAATDIFDFQDRIAAQVAGAILPAVRNAEIAVATSKPTADLHAHDLVLRAYPCIWRQDQRDNAEAIALLREAVALDPRYGRAHALLAWCHAQDIAYVWSRDQEASRQAARQAVAAAADATAEDPTALAAVGAAISMCLQDLPRAASFIESALALDPNHAWGWARYGWLAVYQQKPDEAVSRFERSLALSPLDPFAFNQRIGIASAISMKGEHAEAARHIQAVIDRHPRITWAYRMLAWTAALAGDLPTARDAARKLLAANPNISIETLRSALSGMTSQAVLARMVEGWRLAGLPEK